ncbi:MAG: class I SAM-dependent DNA methyltransferase [Bacteroidia bacterium]
MCDFIYNYLSFNVFMQPNISSIKSYYDELAPQYDENRFANSYGQYLHFQEQKILEEYLPQPIAPPTLSLACGTGRLMEFASIGADISPEMLKIARRKFPEKEFLLTEESALPLAENSLQNAFSWHFFMHLDKEEVKKMAEKVYICLQKGGLFIFDVPSAHRKRLLSRKSSGWHGANAYFLSEIESLAGEKWEMRAMHGILFFPIHRFPPFLRPYLLTLDNWLCRSFLKKYASYLTIVLCKL